MSLQQIPDALGVTPAAFFGDNGAGMDHAIGGEFAGSLTTPGALRLIGNYAKLPPGQRDALVRMPVISVLSPPPTWSRCTKNVTPRE
jgi:hypothetical protein